MPLKTLDKALALAASQDPDGDLIRLTEGVYIPTLAVKPAEPKTRSFFFGPSEGIEVRGGYPAVGVQSDALRDPSVYLTILSADIGQDDTADPPILFDNSFHPVWIEDANDRLVIDGVQMVRGIATVVFDPEFRYRSSGGGVYAVGTFVNAPLDFVLQNCVLSDNVARVGGGLFALASGTVTSNQTPSVRCSSFLSNTAERGDGGAVWSDGVSPELLDSLIVGNTSFGRGAVYFINPSHSPASRIENTTFALNESLSFQTGVQLQIEYFNPPVSPGVLVRNSILVRPLTDSPPTGSLFIVNVDVAGSVFDDSAMSVSYSNISGYADFGNPDLGDFNLSFDDVSFVDEGPPGIPALGDFRLRACSPLVNAGTSTALSADTYDADFDDNMTELLPARDLGARVLFGEVDIGAFESVIDIDSGCPGDMNGDGCVDASDLGLLLGQWGACPLGCQADFDCSGTVGASDLAILLGAFGQCCSSPEAGMGGQWMVWSAESGIDLVSPAVAAQIFGFATIEEFSAWLGTLSATERNTILLGLFAGEGVGS